jgi:malate synthase
MATTAGTAGIAVRGARVERQEEVLTPEALAFLAELRRRFGGHRRKLLARRQERRAEAALTGRLDFLPREVFEQVALADEFVEFLTLPAYEQLDHGRRGRPSAAPGAISPA